MSVREREYTSPISPHSFFPLLHCVVPREVGEVMYGPFPDRTTQQNRWTKSKRERRGERERGVQWKTKQKDYVIMCVTVGV